jgi:hypothetical protein
MGFARYLKSILLTCGLVMTAQAVPQPAQIQVVQNLVIPGRVVDLTADSMLLKAPSGEAFVLPRHLGVRLEDSKVHPHLQIGSQVSAMVPLDSSEVVLANSRMVVLNTGTGVIQLPVTLMPKDMLSSTLIATNNKKGQHQESTLVQAIQSGGMISPESFAYWNQPGNGAGVVIAKRQDGDLLLATMVDGLPAVRQLKTGGMSTDWVTVGSAITVLRDPQLPFYQVEPWKDAAFWQASQTPAVEPPVAIRKVHRGVVPRKVAVAPRHQSRPAAKGQPAIASVPGRSYPRAAVRKAPVVVAKAEEESRASLLLPIYNVVTTPFKSLVVAARPSDLLGVYSDRNQGTLSDYTDRSRGVVPGYNAKTREKDSLPGY